MPEYDVVIVGGGPAGLVALRYCLHAQLRTVMVTPELGGWVGHSFTLRGLEPVETIWATLLVQQFGDQLKATLDNHHVKQMVSKVSHTGNGSFRVHLADGGALETRTVIFTTGASPQRLYVPGEREFWGRGVSCSAISHAPLFRGRDVAVVGAGERTLIAALELAPLARQVYLIAAQPQEFAESPLAKRVLARSNVLTFRNWEVQEILGDDFVTGIALVGANGETRQLPVEGVFVQFALVPNNEMVRGLVKLDKEGHICVDERCDTSVPGLFAAGDVTNIHSEQVLVAIGEGAKAALSAWEFLVTRVE